MAEWEVFCEYVMSGIGADAYWELDTDVGTVGSMVGTSEHPFAGHFNGNGHTLNVDTIGQDESAPFLYINGADIRDLKITGRVWSKGLCGGCVGYAMAGSTNALTDIHVDMDIADYGTLAGGILGNSTTSTTTMLRCSYKGLFYGNTEGRQIGGLWGWADDGGTVVMEDCFVNAWNDHRDIENYSVIGLIDISPAPTVKNVYYAYGSDVRLGSLNRDGSKYAECVYNLDDSQKEYCIYRPVAVCTGDTYYLPAVLQGLKLSYQCTGSPIDLGYTVRQLVGEEYEYGESDRKDVKLEGPVLTKGVEYTAKVVEREGKLGRRTGDELSDEQVIVPGKYTLVIEGKAESGFEGKIERKFKVEGVEPSVEVSVKVNRKNIAVDQEKFEEGALKLCTPDELGQVYNGAPLKVWLDIHLTAVIAEVPAADAALLQGRANELGSTLGDFAIIALYKQVGDGPATRITELPEGMSPLRLNWSVPQELRASGRTFGVMSVHDGEVLEHASDVAGEEVGFDVAKLSTFTLTHKDAQATDSGSGGSGSGGSTAQPQRTTAGTTKSNATTGATKLAKTGDRMASTTFVSAVAVGGTLCLAAAWLARCRERS